MAASEGCYWLVGRAQVKGHQRNSHLVLESSLGQGGHHHLRYLVKVQVPVSPHLPNPGSQTQGPGTPPPSPSPSPWAPTSQVTYAENVILKRQRGKSRRDGAGAAVRS